MPERTSNFDFVYQADYNEELIANLKQAEKLFWTNYEDAGVNLRRVLELWCNEAIKSHNISVNGSLLSDKIKAIVACKTIFPSIMKDDIALPLNNGNMEARDVWRKYCNECSHVNDADEANLPICFEIQCIVFDIVYDFFLEDVSRKGVKLSGMPQHFLPGLAPIGRNQILKHYDSRDSMCEHESITVKYTDAGTVEDYGIARIFKKEDLGEETLDIAARTREMEASLKLCAASSYYGIETLSEEIENNKSDFYIIKYKFHTRPAFLNDKILAEISREDRLCLCYELAAQLNAYHKSGIYHRHLNYDCIVLCEENGKWIPSIIKMEYAKDVFSDHTVIERVTAAQAVSPAKRKYQDEEINFETATEHDWELADIYSLGVLHRDILTGNVTKEHFGKRSKMEKAQVPAKVIDTVMQMTSTNVKNRPTLDEVVKTFETIVN